MLIVLLLTSTLLINIQISAHSLKKYVIPGGESIGLQVNIGVKVTGKFVVDTGKEKISPWKDSDILVDDVIYSVDGVLVDSVTDIQNILKKTKNLQNINLSVKRNNEFIKTNILVVENKQNINSIGLYVKDKLLGVGTLTYIDPYNKSYGALGHSIIKELDFIDGVIVTSSVKSIKKALPGQPGEKRAILETNELGKIKSHNDYGIFGEYKAPINKDELLEVASSSEVSLGKAKIITVVENNNKEEYEIEIVELKKQISSDIKGIKFKVIDDELLTKTGGIIQGMSGSPIIQNGKIIGAVSHVMVDKPNFGYGLYLEWMIKNSND